MGSYRQSVYFPAKLLMHGPAGLARAASARRRFRIGRCCSAAGCALSPVPGDTTTAWLKPQRRLDEPGHGSSGDQGADQRHHLSRQGRRHRQAGMDEPNRTRQRRRRRRSAAGTAPPAHTGKTTRKTARAWQQRPGGQRRIQHACWASRGRRRTSPGAGRTAPLRRRGRDLLLLIRPGNPRSAASARSRPQEQAPPGW